MKSVVVSDEVRIAVPAGVSAEEVRATRGGAQDPVLRLLSDPDITVTASAAVAPTSPRRATTRAARAAGPAQVTVRVPSGERAVLLVERDGVYEWVLPR